MLTRCPACGTVFRVAASQLKAKQGKVRCGRCRQGFDALAMLLDQESPAATAEGQIEPLPTTSLEAAAAEELSAPESSPAGTIEIPTWPLPEVEATAKDHGRRSSIWAVASLVALLLLLLQAVMQFRTELSVLFPETKPALRRACALLGCELALPAKADFLGIESSDMHPGPAGQITLAATLKNRAPFVQAYPDLELSLTDTADQPLLRKVLAPNEYLPKGTDVASGFAAEGKVALNLTLQAGVAGAVGYRIYLFYP
ncbi:hypothetical protein GALL_110350 [mine drainage metagenome]|uniref:Zinc finger/thioredoxin putative domain-containing protein n=1 Tax=mine drainage metagenome TaxID=410659 RepID=A0A1J5SFU4_9ZZZZ